MRVYSATWGYVTPIGAWGSIAATGSAYPSVLTESRLPEHKRVKNRVHLDVRAAPGLAGDERMAALEVEADRLVSHGAKRLGRHEPAPPLGAGHLIMADPEGNEFCLD
ncbi:VOC family protein [Micromonospora inaquosa]|uniref:VOC family protein n=1 Tax=Micromonospora inaquosa TaxID=2203716 RepID=UPI003CC61B65